MSKSWNGGLSKDYQAAHARIRPLADFYSSMYELLQSRDHPAVMEILRLEKQKKEVESELLDLEMSQYPIFM